MEELEQIDVTTEGRRFFDYWFKDIGGLSSKVCPIIARHGEIRAIVPCGTSPKRALQFNAGGLTEVNLEQHWLAPHVHAKLKHSAKGVFVVQDLWARPEDVKSDAPPHFASDGGRSIHYFIEPQQYNPDALLAIEIATISMTTAMFIVENCEVDFADGSVDDRELLALAEGAHEVIIPAYDGESYLIWRRE